MLVADWYTVKELKPNLFLVREPADAAFYILKDGRRALFIDSGLGLLNFGSELLAHLGIDSFTVLNTHAHCDHIGLNGWAEEILISKAEWDKFVQFNDAKQLERFYEESEIAKFVQWPDGLKEAPTQRPWKPTRFVQTGEEIKFASWTLEALHTPGHTCGHMVYLERREGLIFLGDLLYDGTMYAHVPDSSFRDYIDSLRKLNAKLQPSEMLWLSCHNSIPLGKDHLVRTLDVFNRISRSQLSPKSEWIGDSIFLDAAVFEDMGVKVAVRLDDLGQ